MTSIVGMFTSFFCCVLADRGCKKPILAVLP
ncbi:hypothetical protein [Psychrobacter sp. M13]